MNLGTGIWEEGEIRLWDSHLFLLLELFIYLYELVSITAVWKWDTINSLSLILSAAALNSTIAKSWYLFYSTGSDYSQFSRVIKTGGLSLYPIKGHMTESESADTVIKHFVNCLSQSIFGSKTPVPPFPWESGRLKELTKLFWLQ